MSEQRVAVVKKVYETRPDGDVLQMVENREAIAAVFAPLVTDDFEWMLAERGLAGSRRGPAAFADATADYAAAWDSYRHIPERFIDAGDKVVVLAHDHGRIRGGPELKTESGTVWTFREDKICRVETFQSHGRALEAAGIES
jgi:ketosteroid isomerase-like protein